MIEEHQKPNASRVKEIKRRIVEYFRKGIDIARALSAAGNIRNCFSLQTPHVLNVSSVCCHFPLLLRFPSRHLPFSFTRIFVIFMAQNPTPPFLKQPGNFFVGKRASPPLFVSIKVLPTHCLCSLRIGSPHRWHLSGSCQSIWCLQLLTPGREVVWSSCRTRALAPGRSSHSAPSWPSLRVCKTWKTGIARGPWPTVGAP